MARMRYLRDLTLSMGEIHVPSQMSLSLSQSTGHGFYFPCNANGVRSMAEQGGSLS